VTRGLTARDLAAGCRFSLSLAEKIVSGHARATTGTVEAIESFLGARVFSTPAQFRNRREVAAFDEKVALIARTEKLSPTDARDLAMRRFTPFSKTHP
jgi:thymidine phosphorylase